MQTKLFLRGEFIGLPVHITACSDPSLQGVEGNIIDETKNTLIIDSLQGVKQVAKDIATFVVDGVTINGKDIAFRPEDRVRKIK